MNSENKEKIQRYFEEHREEYLADLKKLVDIESTAGEAAPGRPYGEGPAKVLEAAVAIAERYGLKALNREHYGLVMLPDDDERKIDVLGHLDVVPASPESWTKTAPFEMKVIDGIAYGRGVADDKGPTLAAIYALRAVKDLGLGAKGVRIFMGCCEETGAADTEEYFKEYGKPDTAVTPDANWPVVNLEKGGMAGFITDKFGEDAEGGEGCCGSAGIMSIHGGKALNIICGLTTARICGIDKETAAAIAGQVQEATGVSFTVTEKDAGPENAGCCEKTLCVTAEGLSAHASIPELGNNSNTAMLQFLAALPFDAAGCADKIVQDVKALSELFPHGDTNGTAAGICLKDEISGETTCCLDILEYDGKELKACFDSRLPVCANAENTAAAGERVRAAGMQFEGRMRPAHYVPEDSFLVQNLLAAYEDFTGEKGRCLAIGGGTYCHDIKNGVAYGFEKFGADYHMHGDDEYIPVDELITGCAIYTDMYVRLCGE